VFLSFPFPFFTCLSLKSLAFIYHILWCHAYFEKVEWWDLATILKNLLEVSINV
jgi:hypothetical protein